jgi:hypothetical protein
MPVDTRPVDVVLAERKDGGAGSVMISMEEKKMIGSRSHYGVSAAGMHLAGLVLLAALVGCGSAGGAPASGETGILSSALTSVDFFDGSGLVGMRIVTCDWVASQPGMGGHQQAEAICPLPSDWVLVGGGAEIAGEPTPGALLKGSFPNPNNFGANPPNTSWVARSSDNVQPQQHQLRAYAIGLTLVGMAAAVLQGNVLVRDGATVASSNPTIDSAAETDFALVGGGAEVISSGDLFLTESRPVGIAWRATARNNQSNAVGGIKSYVISIRPCPTGWGGRCLSFNSPQISSGPTTGYAVTALSVASPWVTTSIGGQAGQGAGGGARYLADLIPLSGTSRGVTVWTKDHGAAVSGSTSGQAIAIRFVPPQPVCKPGYNCCGDWVCDPQTCPLICNNQ